MSAPTGVHVLEGVLVPTDWAPDGRISSVGLMTFDEGEYEIDTTTIDPHLLETHMTKHVRIRGRIRSGRTIEVERLSLLESANGR